MRKRRRSPEQRIFFLGLILFLIVAGSAGLSTVWLRQQIAESGLRLRELERRNEEVVRLESRLVSELAEAVSPRRLIYLNDRLALGLRPATPDQVIYVDRADQHRFADGRSDRYSAVSEEAGLLLSYTERNR